MNNWREIPIRTSALHRNWLRAKGLVPVFFFSVEPKQFSKLFRLGEIQKSALRVENFENCLGWGKSEKVLMFCSRNHLKTLREWPFPSVLDDKNRKIFRLRRALMLNSIYQYIYLHYSQYEVINARRRRKFFWDENCLGWGESKKTLIGTRCPCPYLPPLPGIL